LFPSCSGPRAPYWPASSRASAVPTRSLLTGSNLDSSQRHFFCVVPALQLCRTQPISGMPDTPCSLLELWGAARRGVQGFTCDGIDLLETVVGRSIVSAAGLATVLLLVLTLLWVVRVYLRLWGVALPCFHVLSSALSRISGMPDNHCAISDSWEQVDVVRWGDGSSCCRSSSRYLGFASLGFHSPLLSCSVFSTQPNSGMPEHHCAISDSCDLVDVVHWGWGLVCRLAFAVLSSLAFACA